MLDFSCSTLAPPRGHCGQNSDRGSESNLATKKKIPIPATPSQTHSTLYLKKRMLMLKYFQSSTDWEIQRQGVGWGVALISKDMKRGLCSLRMRGSKTTLFMAAGEEKKRVPQGNYQQMVNTFLILLSYCVDLYTFVLLC